MEVGCWVFGVGRLVLGDGVSVLYRAFGIVCWVNGAECLASGVWSLELGA